jgi:replicative DNA helicase
MNAVIDNNSGITEPHALPAEQAIIGVLLHRPEMVNIVSQSLAKDDFYFEPHRVIYGAMVEMNAVGEIADLVGIQDRLMQGKMLERVGGPSYLSDLVVNAPSGANIEHYVNLVRERSTRRKMIKAADEIKNAANKTTHDLEKSATSGIDEMFRILRSDGALKAPDPIGKLLPLVIDDIESRQNGGLSGIPTGFRDLDEALMGGVRRGDLVVIAGRPSMGKTALGFQAGLNAAMDGHTVMAFTLEMSRRQITERSIAQVGGIEFSRILSGNLRDEDYDRMAAAIGKLHQIPFLIDDTGGLSIQDIAARARTQAKTGGLSMIIVDYLQIMGYVGREMSRNERLGEISRHAKALAKELDVPFILLSQLNRDVEKRQDKRPLMSDLRESGAIEQDADVIVMMYRDEYYNPDSEFKGHAEAIIRKNRNGEVQTIGLRFEGQKVRFSDLSQSEWD